MAGIDMPMCMMQAGQSLGVMDMQPANAGHQAIVHMAVSHPAAANCDEVSVWFWLLCVSRLGSNLDCLWCVLM